MMKLPITSDSQSRTAKGGSLQQPGSAAKASLEKEAELEASLAADVFNPNETDLQYFLRRKAALEKRQPNDQAQALRTQNL